MCRVRVAAVSYLNTIPFIYGIERSGFFPYADIYLYPPAECADAISSGRADIALIPVAEIPSISNIKIIGGHCISATDNVRTVVLLSESPVSEIKRIYLDPHSRTSVRLVKILAKEYWKIIPEWIDLTDYESVTPSEGDGFVLIGDKVFDYETKFRQKYDLSHEWYKYTGLPFVFAAWVANNSVPETAVADLEKALDYGIKNIENAVNQDRRIDRKTAYKYLTESIDFNLDNDKRESMRLFFRKLEKLEEKTGPG